MSSPASPAAPAAPEPFGNPPGERRLARDWFMLFTYTLLGLAGVMQVFLLLWLNLL